MSPIPSDVTDSIFVELRKRQIELQTKHERKGLWHVSDLVADCTRKSWYSKMADIPHEVRNWSEINSLFLGSAIHEYLATAGNVKMNEIEMALNVFDNSSVPVDTLKGMELSKLMKIVVGTCDAVIYDKKRDKFIIMDFKTKYKEGKWDFLFKTKLEPAHALQIEMYNVMLRAAKDIDAYYGSVVYLDTYARLENSRIFTFKLSDAAKTLDTMQDIMLDLNKTLTTGVLPDRTVNPYMCDRYCPYEAKCVSEEKIAPNAKLIKP